jgi:hypothetical protein
VTVFFGMAVPAVVLAVLARSYAVFTEFGVAAVVIEVLETESVSGIASIRSLSESTQMSPGAAVPGAFD